MTKIEQFKLMFDKLILEHKGVKLNKVLCSRLMWRAGGNKAVFGHLKTLSRFILRFDVSELADSKLSPIIATFGYYPTRKDHRELMETVVKRIGSNISYFDASKWNCHKVSLSPMNIIRGLNTGILRMKGTGLSFKDRLLLSAWICFYLNTVDALAKVDFSNVKKFLCLANSLELENLMTQYLKQKGVKTYSLMEGAYFIQDNELPITNIAFENLTSDIQLCWGQYSKDEFIKYGYPESRMEVVGYPKAVEGKPMKRVNEFRKGVVLLSQYIMETQNRDLIKILSNFSDSLEFSLKLHPSLDYNEYSRLASENGMKIIPQEMTLNECIDNATFDFAIAINSTAYYEALMRGLPCFRYDDGSYTPMIGCDDKFNDMSTFLTQLDRFKVMSAEEIQKEADMALEYAVGWGIDNYKNTFV